MSRTKLCNVRQAREDDLSAILALLLTSFRQFPLFDFLYSPLNKDFSFAQDTLFFWRRRLLLDLLDPEAAVIVAEAPVDILTVSAASDDVDKNGRRRTDYQRNRARRKVALLSDSLYGDFASVKKQAPNKIPRRSRDPGIMIAERK
jgi:hypothetical protein